MREHVIQIRASGVRVKYLTTSPSLVAMTATQVPIITWEGRFITPRECQNLQSMEALKWIPENRTKAYEAFGNAVNVRVASLVAAVLIGCTPEGRPAVCDTVLSTSASDR